MTDIGAGVKMHASTACVHSIGRSGDILEGMDAGDYLHEKGDLRHVRSHYCAPVEIHI